MVKKFIPYVGADKSPSEFTLRAAIIGVFLGLLFGLGITFLALKVGMSISASIPASIMSMGILKLFKRSTILENNIAQTIASAGEGLAGGVAFTIPALFFASAPTTRLSIFFLALFGGLLGVFCMIPLRKIVIVDEHERLPFPEGTACAEILKIGQKKPEHGLPAFFGFIIGGVYRMGMSIFYLWPEVPRWTLPIFRKIQFNIDATPALLGVGFLIGPKLSSIILAGSIFSWWVLIPMIDFFAEGKAAILPSLIPISAMTAEQIWDSYIRYIGAGAIALAGVLSLIKIFPVLFKLIGKLKLRMKKVKKVNRLALSIPLFYVPIAIVLIGVALWAIPGLNMNLVTVILSLIFGFFFVLVTSFTVGIVGVSSNPVSGMIITSVIATCMVFIAFGWTGQEYLIAAITLGAVVSIAACIAADTSQDLKTGFLVGGTPIKQQLGMILGVALVATIMGFSIKLFDEAYDLGSPSMPAPQATLVFLLAKGMLSGDLPLSLIVFGVMIAVVMRILRIPIMPFAIGMYLPLSLPLGICVGGIVAAIVQRYTLQSEDMQIKGTLFASGLIGADALLGVLIGILTIVGVLRVDAPAYLSQIFSLLFFLLLAFFTGAYICKREKFMHSSKR